MKRASLSRNYATKSPLVTVGRPKFTPKTALLFDDHDTHLIHPSLDYSSSQTASGSNQPFCHSTLSGPTERQTNRPTPTQTDRWARRQVYTISAYARYIDRERRANNYPFLEFRNRIVGSRIFQSKLRPVNKKKSARHEEVM